MLLNIEPGLIIWTILTFLILMVILRAVAWKPLLAMLDDRERRIQDSLEQAEKARAEAERSAKENLRAMEKAQAEVQTAIAQGRATAERVAQEVRERAEADARQLLEQAQRTIEQEKHRAIQELHTQVADLAILAAGRILDANMDESRNRKLVDDFIADIPQSN